jgi:hypothetical protein
MTVSTTYPYVTNSTDVLHGVSIIEGTRISISAIAENMSSFHLSLLPELVRALPKHTCA